MFFNNNKNYLILATENFYENFNYPCQPEVV